MIMNVHAILMGVCLLLFSACDKSPGPNVILIVADDLGCMDVGFMGSTYYETPNLDQLASGGVVFKRAYASAANCAPSRACLMSGRYTPAHGIYTVNPPDRGDPRTRRIIPSASNDVLDDSFHTLAEAMKDHGYATCNIGKWHLGEDPCTQGFEYNVGGSTWGHPGSYFAPYGKPDLEAPPGEYLTDRLTMEALGFIRGKAANEEPFFLYLPYYAVHTPIQPKPEFERKYQDKGPSGCQSRADYAGMVDNLDRNIGLIREELKVLGIEESTLVIFTSDNGGIRSISCQDPLRAGKGSYYEGGIRVPLVVSWPGKLPARTSDEAVINLDFYPSILDAAGIDLPGVQLDGLSLWQHLLKDEALSERSLFFHFPIYLQAYDPIEDDGRDPLFRTRPGSVIIKGDWKLHYFYEDGSVELYNLKADPGESKDLNSVNSGKASELKAELLTWLDGHGAPVSFQANPEYDPEVERLLIEKVLSDEQP